ncbi:hypothetical protein [Lysobacter gummosus]
MAPTLNRRRWLNRGPAATGPSGTRTERRRSQKCDHPCSPR